MLRVLFAIVVTTVLVVSPSMAQEVISFVPEMSVQSTDQDLVQSKALTEPTKLHITDRLLESDEGQAAMDEFRSRKAAGIGSVGAASKVQAQLGAQQIFKVFNLDTNQRDNIDFTLKETSDRFNIWVETAEISNGHVLDQDIADLKAALATQTPSGSFNSSAGIIVNDEEVFGDPPDVDGDSKTDVLLVDVRDDFDPDNGNFLFVGGFFDPSDLTATGNFKDILYLDTMPSIVNSSGGRNPIDGLLGTAAHEYQHLIHANYDQNESTFVNEAQSEWAELMNGYDGRDMAFLSSLAEHATAFFNYRSDVLTDRERGQLFTLYVAEQLGVSTAGSFTRQTFNDQSGYGQALGSVNDFQNILPDFFTANLLNDTSVDPKFGYSNPFYTNVRTIVDETIDGRTETDLGAKTISMEPGSVRYSSLQNVTDVSILVDGTSVQSQAVTRAMISVRLLKKQGGGAYTVEDHAASADPITLSGTYDEVIMIITHKQAAVPGTTVSMTYSADWSDGTGNTFTESVKYDDDDPSGDFFAFSSLNGFLIQTTRFARPDYNGTIVLDKVDVAPNYFNQFAGSELGDDAPRDFKLMVLGDTGGLPDLDKTIFSLDVTDTRTFAPASTAPFVFMTVNLTQYASELNNLPDTFHVALGESGTDQNYLVLSPSTYTTEDVSFIGDDRDNSWGALWDQTLGDGTSMMERVFPIRTGFIVNEIVGLEDEVASELSFELRQNYPNPFVGVSTVEFQVPVSSDVSLQVFDLLGRQVTTVVDGLFAAGTHTVGIDARNWASGIYLYRLRAGDVSISRTMSVVD